MVVDICVFYSPCCFATQGSPDIIVAVIDSGIYLDHPDIKDSLWVNSGEIPGNGIDDDGNGEAGSISISRPLNLFIFFLYHVDQLPAAAAAVVNDRCSIICLIAPCKGAAAYPHRLLCVVQAMWTM